jgi:putative addiction module component (TIGR02574 family)
MSTQQLENELLALPLSQRIEIAQTLWQSITDTSDIEVAGEEREAIELAKRRAAELASGVVQGRPHDEVMKAARRAIECG